MTGRSRPPVCLDSNILGWAVKLRKDTDSEMRRRSVMLIDALVEQRATLVVPTIVLTEVLADCTDSERESLRRVMEEMLTIADYSARAAMIAAQYLRDNPDRHTRFSPPISRKVIRADIMIVATAKAVGCSQLYSNDAGMRSISRELGIESFDLPVHGEDLWADAGLAPVLPSKLKSLGESVLKVKKKKRK